MKCVYRIIILLTMLMVACMNMPVSAATGIPSGWGTPTPDWGTVITLTKPDMPSTTVTLRITNSLPDQQVYWSLGWPKAYIVKKWNPMPLQPTEDQSISQATLTLSVDDFPANAPSGKYYLFVRVSPYPWFSTDALESTIAVVNYVSQNPNGLCPSAPQGTAGGPIVIQTTGRSESDNSNNGLIVSSAHPATMDLRIYSPGADTKVYVSLHTVLTGNVDDVDPAFRLIKKLPAFELSAFPLLYNSKMASITITANDFPPEMPDGLYQMIICVPDPTRYEDEPWGSIVPGQLLMEPPLSLQRGDGSVFVIEPKKFPALWSKSTPVSVKLMIKGPVTGDSMNLMISRPDGYSREIGPFPITTDVSGDHVLEFTLTTELLGADVINGAYQLSGTVPSVSVAANYFMSGAFYLGDVSLLPADNIGTISIEYPPTAWQQELVKQPELKNLNPIELRIRAKNPSSAMAKIQVWLARSDVDATPQLRDLGTFPLAPVDMNGESLTSLIFNLADIVPPVASGDTYAFLVDFTDAQRRFLSGRFIIDNPNANLNSLKPVPPKLPQQPAREKINQGQQHPYFKN